MASIPVRGVRFILFFKRLAPALGSSQDPIYNRYVEFKSITGCQIVHLVDRSDLFKISNLVCNGRKTVRSLYCSLQGQTDRRFMVGTVT